MKIEYLPNRKAVIDCSIQIMDQAEEQWLGMGRTAAWIKLPDFRKAVAAARHRNVAFKIVVFYEGDASTHCASWVDVGAEVRFFDHGYIRVIIADSHEGIIAFPKVATSLSEDREYFGFHVSGELPTSELLNYFKQIWEESQELEAIGARSEQSATKIDRISFAAGVLRAIVRVIQRAFPEWFHRDPQ